MMRNLGELGINMQKIVNRLKSNQNLLKLLYYTDKDPLSQPDITQDIYLENIYEKLIKIVPRIGATETSNSIIALTVISADQNPENDQFLDIVMRIEVLVPMTQWIIKDSNLRPYAIIGEVQKSLNNRTIDNFGRLQNDGFTLSFMTEEMVCFEMKYIVTSYD